MTDAGNSILESMIRRDSDGNVFNLVDAVYGAADQLAMLSSAITASDDEGDAYNTLSDCVLEIASAIEGVSTAIAEHAAAVRELATVLGEALGARKAVC